MTEFFGHWSLWVLLLAIGVFPNEVWRVLGVMLSRGLDERSEIVVWVRAVATAILAGVIAKLTFFAPGALAEIPIAIRLAAVIVGLGAFFVTRRSVLTGLIVGELALVALAMMVR
jgi:hypothetical protein